MPPAASCCASSRSRRALRLAFWAVLPLAAVLVPLSFWERLPSLCLSRLFFHRACPGCGMVRAISALLHGDLGAAARHNQRVFVVLPLLMRLWWGEMTKAADAFSGVGRYRIPARTDVGPWHGMARDQGSDPQPGQRVG